METIKVVFSRNNHSLFSHAVRFVTWSPWSHVAIMIDDNTVIESTFKRRGVKVDSFENFKTRATHCEIREFQVNDRNAIIRAAKSKIGEPYNVIGLIGLFLHIGSWKGIGTEFCSEFVEFAFAIGGTLLFNEKFKARIVPQHIYMLPSKFIESFIL